MADRRYQNGWRPVAGSKALSWQSVSGWARYLRLRLGLRLGLRRLQETRRRARLATRNWSNSMLNLEVMFASCMPLNSAGRSRTCARFDETHNSRVHQRGCGQMQGDVAGGTAAASTGKYMCRCNNYTHASFPHQLLSHAMGRLNVPAPSCVCLRQTPLPVPQS